MDYFEPEYKIARDGTWYPSNFYGKEKNMLGFTNELMLMVAKNEDFRVVLFNKGYTGLFHGLDSGSYDAIISPLNPTTANMTRYLFSEPIYLTGPVVIVEKGKQQKVLDYHEGLTIAIRRGFKHDVDFTKYPEAVIRVYDDQESMVQALIGDRIDGILMEAIPAYNITQGFYSGQVVVATKPLTGNGLRLITLKTAKGQALIDSFNAGLSKAREDGTFKKLLDSWQLIDTEAPMH
jgi:polar amino acid transport system substrate-binding protein